MTSPGFPTRGQMDLSATRGIEEPLEGDQHSALSVTLHTRPPNCLPFFTGKALKLAGKDH